MEYTKKVTKVLVKDVSGDLVQVIPETEAAAVKVDSETTVSDAISSIQSGKANAVHQHSISDIDNLQTTLNGMAEAIDEISDAEILAVVNS